MTKLDIKYGVAEVALPPRPIRVDIGGWGGPAEKMADGMHLRIVALATGLAVAPRDHRAAVEAQRWCCGDCRLCRSSVAGSDQRSTGLRGRQFSGSAHATCAASSAPDIGTACVPSSSGAKSSTFDSHDLAIVVPQCGGFGFREFMKL